MLAIEKCNVPVGDARLVILPSSNSKSAPPSGLRLAPPPSPTSQDLPHHIFLRKRERFYFYFYELCGYDAVPFSATYICCVPLGIIICTILGEPLRWYVAYYILRNAICNVTNPFLPAYRDGMMQNVQQTEARVSNVSAPVILVD